MEFTILILEKNEREHQNVRSFLKRLSHPIRILDAAEPGARTLPPIDVVIAGLSGWQEEERESVKTDLELIRALHPQAQIILCAPQGMADLDSVSMELQARSLLLKPLDIATFIALLEKTLSLIRKRRVRALYAKDSRKSSHIAEITGRSEKIQNVLNLLRRVSQSKDTSVLLLGESGTGKSLFARALHEMSDRSSEHFIEINCAVIPPNLLESELFGYEPGAFTDAMKEKMGLIELADGGTLFLDEISEVDIKTQAKLLKFLDTKRIRRLGGRVDIRVDSRVVVASNRDLKEEVKKRKFREDLFYRLDVVEVVIPPLRERRNDIVDIAAYYLDAFRKKFNKPKLNLTPGALDLLCDYHWPGNVRELINVIERAVLLGRGDNILPEDLPLPRSKNSQVVSINVQNKDITVVLPPQGVQLEILEKKVIEETLKRTCGNVLKASAMLGIKRGALRYKLAKYGIDPRPYSRKLVGVRD
jgi:DNA-binding NtrC family response regulator